MGQSVSFFTGCTGVTPTVADSDHPVNYLLTYRLQWGEPDRLSLLPSHLKCDETDSETSAGDAPVPMPEYFTADIYPSLVSIIQNDWPYSGASRSPRTVYE